jgi:hypothetical protein
MRARGDSDFWQPSETLNHRAVEQKAFDGDHPRLARRNHFRR